jgi:hypothetical protein
MSDSSQFITTDDSKIDTTKMISINLCTGILPIHKNITIPQEPDDKIIGGYAKTFVNDGYIQIPYICPGGAISPNAKYADNPNVKNYKTENLYIFNKSHMIDKIKYDLNS